jgi:hypothetical protein
MNLQNSDSAAKKARTPEFCDLIYLPDAMSDTLLTKNDEYGSAGFMRKIRAGYTTVDFSSTASVHTGCVAIPMKRCRRCADNLSPKKMNAL